MRLFLKSGYVHPTPALSVWRSHGYVRVSNTNHLFYPVGSVQIPPTSMHETEGEQHWKKEDLYSVAVEAEAVSGSGTLVMDRFAVIPESEGTFHIEKTFIGTLDDPSRGTFLLTTPSGKFLVNAPGGQLIAMSPQLQVARDVGFSLPPGAGSLVYAAQRSTVQTPTDEGYVAMEYYPRWEEMASA